MNRDLIQFGCAKWGALLALVLAFMRVQVWAQEVNLNAGFQEVRIERVMRDPRSAQPVVILSNLERNRGMLIWIGEAEASALEAAKQKTVHQRPMTHDLLTGMLRQFEARITQVRITELKENIFYARILIQTQRGQIELDARPSDSMVLALQASCPILVERSLFNDQSLPLDLPALHTYGLEVQELDEDLKVVLGYLGDGILVTQVEQDSPAGRDGILREDILVEAGGRPLRSIEDLEEVFSDAQGNLEVQIFRKGTLQLFTLKTASGS